MKVKKKKRSVEGRSASFFCQAKKRMKLKSVDDEEDDDCYVF